MPPKKGGAKDPAEEAAALVADLSAAADAAAVARPATVGVCLGAQVLPSSERVPREAHDRVLDVVLAPD